MDRRVTVRKLTPYIFLVPAIFLIAAFLVYPLITVFRYSTWNYNAAFPDQKGFIGLENFRRMFTDKLDSKMFFNSLKVSLRWVVTEVVCQVVLGTILALLLDEKFKGRGLYRCAVFFPWAVSGVLTSMLWSLIYSQEIGVLNTILRAMGVINENVAWLGNKKLAFPATVVAEIWRGIPFFAITILAALQNISLDIREAAKVDGANLFQTIFLIKLPMLKDTLILTTLLRSVWEFNNVDLIFTLTGGGPASATTTLTMLMTNTAIKVGNYGYGSALAVVSFVILLCFAAIYLRLTGFGKSSEA